MNKPIRKGLLFSVAALLLSLAVGCSEKEPASISVDPNLIELDWNQALVPVTVTTNSDWEASSDQSWCRLSVSKGRETQVVNVIVDQYAEDTGRYATVTFTAKGEKDMVTTILVSQHADNWIPNEN